jgi:hypothetical protein
VTYQGRLFDGTNAANGPYEIRFGLFASNTGGPELEAATNDVAISNGLFTTTFDLDRALIPDPAAGGRWLEIGVRTNGSASPFVLLSERQPLTFSPYAIRASVASVAEGVSASSIQNSDIQSDAITADKIAGGEVVKSLNTLHDDVTLAAGANTTIMPAGNTLKISSPTDWHLGGNAGTTAGTDFIGTTDNQPLEFKVDGQRAFQLANPSIGAPMVIGGAGNSINDVSGGTIAGGYSNVIASAAYESAVGGGAFNSIQMGAHQSRIGGGAFNSVEYNAGYGTIAGGSNNVAGADFSFVGGGRGNEAWGTNSTISGGNYNHTTSLADTIGGGWNNYISTDYGSGVIAGGTQNHISGSSSDAVIGGGYQNFIETNGFAATIAGGYFNFASGSLSVIGGGEGNVARAGDGVIAGGYHNTLDGLYNVIGGGYGNHESGLYAVTAGGIFNTNSGFHAVIGGGQQNTISNAASAVIAGGAFNRVLHVGSISYGDGNYSVIGGGSNNWANQDYCVVGGGSGNQAGGDEYLSFGYDTVAGGQKNTATGDYGTVGGGYWNQATGYASTVVGGNINVASGWGATVLGGDLNQAIGDDSIAAGLNAIAAHSGAFVWADDTPGSFSSTITNQFAIRANNGVMVQSTNVALDLRGGGAIRVAGAGAGTSTPAFIHQATAGNTAGDETTIDNPHCNNHPHAILIVTQNWNPGGGTGHYNAHPIGVYYYGSRWAIFNEDSTSMPTNVAFNVLVINQ